MSEHTTSWNDRLELTVTTPGGETVTLDIPTLLHESGLLSHITRNGSVPLRINHATGQYVGVKATHDGKGYTSLSGRNLVASTSAREVALSRALALGRKRLRETTSTPGETLWQPTSPEHSQQEEEVDEDCRFVRERTREERDVEGRSNAIVLEN